MPPVDVGDRLLLRAALAQLPARQRQVVFRHFWGLSVDEVARDLGISSGSVRSHCSRALRRLNALKRVNGVGDLTMARAHRGLRESDFERCFVGEPSERPLVDDLRRGRGRRRRWWSATGAVGVAATVAAVTVGTLPAPDRLSTVRAGDLPVGLQIVDYVGTAGSTIDLERPTTPREGMKVPMADVVVIDAGAAGTPPNFVSNTLEIVVPQEIRARLPGWRSVLVDRPIGAAVEVLAVAGCRRDGQGA